MSKLLFRRPSQSLIRFALFSIVTFSLVLSCTLLSWTSPAQGQLPPLPTGAASNPLVPPEGVTRNGEYEIASIQSPLDNKNLFDVTSPTIFNRDKVPDGKLPVEIRAQEINERLWRVLNRTYNTKQMPTVTIATLNNRPVIQISNDQLSRPVRLITVTEPDSDQNGKTLDELAQEWQKILQDEMVRFKQMTAPDVILQRLGQALQILVGLLVASGVIWLLHRLLTRRQQALETRYQQQLAAIAQAEKVKESDVTTQSAIVAGEATEVREVGDQRSQFLATLQNQLSVKRRLDLDKFLKWVLFWVFIGIWYIGIARIISTIPLLMRWSLQFWATPLLLLIIWFGISLAIRISKSLIDRALHSWKVNPLIPLGEAQRIELRTVTIAEALKGFVTVVLVIVGILWSLGLFNVPTGSILAGGAVVAFAISFGSQSLVKDLINGCLILIEDQFAVGDVIQVNNKSGLVENLNLRTTQLRDAEGSLITVPNSSITEVKNLSRLWSRVDFSIAIAYESDLKQALSLLDAIAQQMYSEPQWHERMLDAPQVLGVDHLSHEGMLLRVWLKTAPLQQWIVGREFRYRVRLAFEDHQIQIGKPQLVNYVGSSPEVDAANV